MYCIFALVSSSLQHTSMDIDAHSTVHAPPSLPSKSARGSPPKWSRIPRPANSPRLKHKQAILLNPPTSIPPVVATKFKLSQEALHYSSSQSPYTSGHNFPSNKLTPTTGSKQKALTPSQVPDILKDLPKETIPESIFTELCKELAQSTQKSKYNWKMLGRYLLLDDDSIDGIASSSTKLSVEQKVLEMLSTWYKSDTAHSKTYHVLAEALVDAKHLDLIKCFDTVKYKQATTLPTTDNTEQYDITLSSLPISEALSELQHLFEYRKTRGYNEVKVSLKFKK